MSSAVVSAGDLNANHCNSINPVGGHAELNGSSHVAATSSTDESARNRTAFYANFNVGVYDSFFSIVEDASKTGSEVESGFMLCKASRSNGRVICDCL